LTVLTHVTLRTILTLRAHLTHLTLRAHLTHLTLLVATTLGHVSQLRETTAVVVCSNRGYRSACSKGSRDDSETRCGNADDGASAKSAGAAG